MYTYCFVPTQDTHTHTPSSFNRVWPRALRKLHDVVCASRLCWCKCHRVTQVLDSAMANQGPLMLLQMLLQLPQAAAAHSPIPAHNAASSSPGLSCTSCSQPSPFLCLSEVHGMYPGAFSSWKILTNRKFSRFPGLMPNLYIRNACPYFQFFPFSAIPPFLSGNAQLRLSGL